MKKLLIAIALFVTMANTTFSSETFIERFYEFSTRDSAKIEEINYYLEKCWSVKIMESTPCSAGDEV